MTVNKKHTCLRNENVKTRMHSSRMRTARLLPVSPSMHCSRGCTWSWGCTCPEGGVPAPGAVPARGRTSLEGVPAWGVYLPGGVCILGGVPAWGCTCLGVYLVLGGYLLLGDVPARGVAPAWGGCTCPRGVPACGVPTQVPPLWTEWQTGVKILPCPKLRLRAVIKMSLG